MNNKSVYVIILNYNHLVDLKETINSFKKQNYPNLKLVVSDNGSTDGTIEYIRKENSDIVLLENKENLGWAAGNNVGIQYALENKADYILLANNDLYIANVNIITVLVNDIKKLKEKKVKIIGTNVNYYSQKEKTHNDGWILFPESEKKGKVFNEYRKNYVNNLGNHYKLVDFVSGCFMLIDSELFSKIGLIDELFFIYAEDTEFSFRAWKNGYASVINKNLTIYHKISNTNKVGSPFSMYLKTRNLNYFLKKHKKDIPDYYYFKWKYIFGVLKTFVRIIIYPSYYYGKKYEVLKATYKGFFHGIFNKNLGNKL